MYNYQIYSAGLQSKLQVKWHVHCETPLVIHNGTSPCGESNLANINYNYAIEADELKRSYIVPASSVRGCLRAWTISNLVDKEDKEGYSALKPQPKTDGTTELEPYKPPLNPSKAYQLVASLFGLAFDAGSDTTAQSNMGRIRLETTPFHPTTKTSSSPHINESYNARIQKRPRTPIDRVTQAAKEGGLHFSEEFCRGEKFDILISILNPRPSDLGLLSIWAREINIGLIRIGALASIGRGRISIQEATYTLWQNSRTNLLNDYPNQDRFSLVDIESTGYKADALAQFWQMYNLPVDNLSLFEADLHLFLQDSVS